MTTTADRPALVRRALLVEKVSIAWMIVEGALAVASGILAHSVALIAFGFDSVLELIAAVALYHRLRGELLSDDETRKEQRERRALFVVGVTLLLLCLYVLVDAGRSLLTHKSPEKSLVGLGVAVAALVVMPFLARAKLQLGRQIPSRALVADGKETIACAWLSGAVVLGVGLNAMFEWWWADPVAALAMIPFLVREGREAIQEARGKGDDDDDDDD